MIADRKIGDWENLSIFGLFSDLGRFGIRFSVFATWTLGGIKQLFAGPSLDRRHQEVAPEHRALRSRSSGRRKFV